MSGYVGSYQGAASSLIMGGTAFSFPTAPYSSGLASARPSTAGPGAIYFATDEQIAYQSKGDGTWLVLAEGGAQPEKAADGPFAQYGGWHCPVLVAQPSGANDTSGVLMFYPTATPTGAEILIACQDAANTNRGWMLGPGVDAGDRALLNIYSAGGPAAWTDLTGATFAGLLNQVHALAWAFTGGNLRFSFDGGAVATVSYSLASYVPPNTGDKFVIGETASTAYPSASSKIVAFKGYSTVISDANLRVASGLAARTAYRIPASLGTEVCSWNAAFQGPRATRCVDLVSGEVHQNGYDGKRKIAKTYF